MRRSLSLKDDDFRLSFLYGNFTTLTRFTEMDLERVLTERLSPLFVSIHATDPEVRAELLRNRRGATSLRWLRALLDGGIEVHGQIVVCPGRNDGVVLEDTLAGILDRYPELATVACVPLGVSRFTREADLRPHTRDEAEAVCDAVEDWQGTFLRAVGRRLVFAADEYYLMAERPFPAGRRLRGLSPARERDRHGPGLRGRLRRRPIRRPSGCVPASSPPSTGRRPPATGPRGRRPARAGRGEAERRPVAILTGEYGARVLAPLVDRIWAYRTSGWWPWPIASSGATSVWPASSPAPTWPPSCPRQPVGHRYLHPRRLPVGGAVPRRPHRRRPAPTGRGRGHRRRVAASGPRRPGRRRA